MAAALHVRADPQVSRHAPVDPFAQHEVAVQALVENELRRQAADAFLDLDAVVVERDGQPVDGPRREDDADGPGIGGFRLQAGVAALQEVVLVGRRVGDAAPLLFGHPAARALLEAAPRTRGPIETAFDLPGTGIAAHVKQVEALGLKQFTHVRGREWPAGNCRAT